MSTLPVVSDWGTIVLPRPAVMTPAGALFAAPGGTPYLAPAADLSGSTKTSLRILMVEDDVALANMYALRLRRDGHDVTLVHDGESGLEHAVHGDYDLVFLDINLPRMDGITILHRMRESELAAYRPVVILSNYNEPPLIVRGEELGVRRYLVKSEVTPAQLAASVHDWTGP